jgi:hypothetical protein
MAKSDEGSGNASSSFPAWGDLDLGGGIVWAEVDPKDLIRFVDVVTRAGARVTLSVSKSSGALGVNVYANSEGKTWYPGTVEAAKALLDGLVARFSEAANRK